MILTRFPIMFLAALTGLLAACNTTPPAANKPVIQSFTANPGEINAGDSSTLSWTVTGADTLKLNPGNLDVTSKTSEVVTPAADTPYTLTAINEAGSTQATVTVTVNTEGSTVSQTVRAAEGGTLQTGGATLAIPANALNQDTLVTLSVGEAPAAHAENPMQPSGPQVSFDLGGARLLNAANLETPFSPQPEMEYIVTEQSAENAEGGSPATRVHAATLEGESAVSLAVVRDGAYTVQAIPRVEAPARLQPAAEGVGNTSLQVPFYWQAGLPWCVPTSLAMALNYFQPLPGVAGRADAPSGRVANWTLAGLIKQDAASGAGIDSLTAMGVPETSYSSLNWDADLIPSAPFTSYVILATTGFLGFASIPMRPVWTLSDRQWHAYVITGLSADGVYLNDSNARWMGTHPALTWQQFRDANCTLEDPNDPSKGCSGEALEELWTLVFYANPRPEAERRGTIELGPNQLRLHNPSGELISNWKWDGNPYANGYYFDDATGKSLWSTDNEFGRILPRSSQLRAGFNIVNVSESSYPFEVLARLYVNDGFKLERSATLNVGAYNRGAVNLDFGNLSSLVGAVSGPVTGRIEINLRQGGVIQDVKNVSFRLGPDPSDLPYVTIRNAGLGVTTLKDVPVALIGEAYDRYRLPDGVIPVNRLAWSENGVALGNGPNLTTAFSTTGQHLVTLTGTSEYGVQATASVFVNVIDPVRNPGEVVIDYPANNSTIGITSFGTVDVNLVGHATYSDGQPVPSDRLFWTRSDGSAIGTGSSTVVTLPGYCSNHSYTINLTARTLDGSPIGTRSITITIAGPPC